MIKMIGTQAGAAACVQSEKNAMDNGFNKTGK